MITTEARTVVGSVSGLNFRPAWLGTASSSLCICVKEVSYNASALTIKKLCG